VRHSQFLERLPAYELHSTSLSANTEAFKALEVKMAAAKAQISTNLQSVNTRLEKLLASKPESEEDMKIITQKRGVEEQQKAVLMQCLLLC
jgi:methanogenic corrinoid protein MtbC1